VCTKKLRFVFGSLYIVPPNNVKYIFEFIVIVFDGMLRRSAFRPDRSCNTEYETLCCKCLDDVLRKTDRMTECCRVQVCS
jgi:hypothetical protein